MACSHSPALVLVCPPLFTFACLRLPVCVCTHLLSLAPVHCSYPLVPAPHLCAPSAVAILALTSLLLALHLLPSLVHAQSHFLLAPMHLHWSPLASHPHLVFIALVHACLGLFVLLGLSFVSVSNT